MRMIAFVLAAAAFFITPKLSAQGSQKNKTKINEFIIEPPTLLCAGFQWTIAGDDNRNAGVKVQTEKKGKIAGKTDCLCCGSAVKGSTVMSNGGYTRRRICLQEVSLACNRELCMNAGFC
jgi:hypothetical protein